MVISELLAEFNQIKETKISLEDWLKLKKKEFEFKKAELNLALDFLENLQEELHPVIEEKEEKTILSDDKVVSKVKIVNKLNPNEPKVEELGDLSKPFREYGIPFPPVALTNSSLNSEILDSGSLTPELFMFFRILTHPYKKVPLKEEVLYLDYLIDIEQWNKEWILYLISGTYLEKNYQPKAYDSNSETESEIQKVETYIKGLKKEIQKSEGQQNKRIIITLSKESFDILFHPQPMCVFPTCSQSMFLDTMRRLGYGLTPYCSKVPNAELKNVESKKD